MPIQRSKFILMLAMFVLFCATSQAATGTLSGVSGYVSSIVGDSVFITEKHGVVFEVPKSVVEKTNPKVKTGEFVSIKVEKSQIKATKAKSIFNQK